MLKLKNITKDYVSGDSVVHALRGVSLEFRENEFVSILGQSGCGKTTLLNIIGGLDKYTDGDLEINAKSTKNFTDRDWDTYRNHSIGFIFQSYNLIPHQTVLSNVELALTLSGVSSKERRERAKEALIKVGLGDQINKKPNQMSGGQMQRVAIARALVNDPDILLADEPTGALDSETSVQIMELIKEIANDRLVIMVTHNPELAEQYSTRIINLLDGKVVSDSNPYTAEENVAPRVENSEENADSSIIAVENDKNSENTDTSSAKKNKNEGKTKKTSMSFFTAFLLSLNNLLTKKGRTILTSFAGSIGIIGIALIFAVSNGTNAYINHVQESTLSSYPITLEDETVDFSSLIGGILGAGSSDSSNSNTNDRVDDAVYKDAIIAEMLSALSNTDVNENELDKFKVYLENELDNPDSELSKAVTAVQYSYDMSFPVFTTNPNGEIIKADTNELMMKMITKYVMAQMSVGGTTSGSMSSMGSSSGSGGSFNSMMTLQMWQELIPGIKEGKPISDIVTDQYDLLYGSWPNSYNEVILVVNENNELDDLTLYALGLLSEAEIDKIIDSAVNQVPLTGDNKGPWKFEDICKRTYRVIIPAHFYVYDEASGTYIYDENKVTSLYNDKDKYIDLSVTGVVRLKDDVDGGIIKGTIGYTSMLTEKVIEQAESCEAVKAQRENSELDVLTGLPFQPVINPTLTDEEKSGLTDEQIADLVLSKENGLKKDYIVKYLNYLIEKGDKEALAQIYDKITVLNVYNSSIKPGSDVDKLLKSTLDENGEFDKEKAIELILSYNTNAEYTEEYIRDAFKDVTYPVFATFIYSAVRSSTEASLTPMLKSIPQDSKIAVLKLSSDISKTDITSAEGKLAFATLKKNFALGMFLGVVDFANAGQQDIVSMMMGMTDSIKLSNEELLAVLQNAHTPSSYAVYFNNAIEFSTSTKSDNLAYLGDVDLASPSSINIYTATFEDKDIVTAIVKEQGIDYTDYLKLMMSGITTIIDAITYVLVAFVATSLIVSSIMIGVITLISVQERTKEIGVLRAMGASKRDISRVFNAETLIIGFASGILGIGVTLILSEIINIILRALTGIEQLRASVGFWPAVILIAISMCLTLIAGLIPSRVAAKKDPVIALRTE
ncbi:MAG: ABC transporter ATP-binding protein/permease [Clostridia bacterium]|nr:ABC transporter ATP-binding protein/permease [Clostridia bacterium]